MTDGLTKWIEAKAYRESTAKNAANFLMENIILRFGVPITVITDNGSHFKGEFHELCQRLNIQHQFSTSYHPQTVGQDERSNGLLLNRIRKWRKEEDKRWDDDLTSSIFACNTRRISTMNASTIETLMGYTAQTASKLKHNLISKQELSHKLASISNPNPDVTTQERLRILETFRDEVIRVRDFNQDKIKHRYDSKIRSKAFTVGQEVLMYDSSLLKQWSRKLDERWLGPFQVKWVGSKGAYSIGSEDGTERLVSGDQLKLYHRRS